MSIAALRLLGATTLFVATAALAGPHTLPPEVAAALTRAKVPAEALVALVQPVDAPKATLAWQTERPINPASLMKLVTTDAALELLGPAWTWSTPVWLDGHVANGVLEGNLVIKGSGDPTLVLERLWLLLRRVRQQGVREIRGDIVLDRSVFAPAEQDPAEFDGEPLRPYNVRPDALLLNFHSIAITVTPDPAARTAHVSADLPLSGVRIDASVPLSSGPCENWRAGLQADFADPTRLHFAGAFPLACGEKSWNFAYSDPASYNARAIAGLWGEVGGTLDGHVHDGVAPTTPPTFEVVSPALPEVIRNINKYSNNVMAQQVFLTLGLVRFGAGTPATARTALKQWLDERFGRAADVVVIDNGSGLSRETRVSARLLGDLLLGAWSSPVMSELMSSLPVAGVDGTLKRSHSPLGRAHLKTGSLRDVAGVAGFVLADSGRRYVVVAIVNHANANAARPALDALVQWAASEGDGPRR